MKTPKIISQVFFTFLVLSSYPCRSADDIETFFSMTPAELAAISVTIATGTPKPNFQSAGSVSVISADQIKTMGATELHEVLETVPGIHTSIQPVTNDLHYSVRGIANNQNSQLLFLMNGTRINTAFRGATESAVDLPIAAIERVEVIRGPGSAVYGADAFAGVVNIITKKAANIHGTQLGVRSGNWDSQSGWGQHGSQYAGWDIATSIQYQQTAGDSGRIIKEDSQSTVDRIIGTNASLAPGAMNTRYKSLNSHLNLNRKYWDIDFWAFNGFDIGTRTGPSGALDPKGFGESTQYLGDLRYSTEDKFTDWQFLAHLSYLHTDVNAKVNLFPRNAILPIDGKGEINIDVSDFSIRPALFTDGAIVDIRHIQRIPSLELTSLYKGLDKHLFRMSAGFRYEELSFTDRSNFGYGSPLPAIVNGTLIDKTGTPLAFLKDTSRKVASLMLQDEWEMTNDLHLTAGVRYDHYSDFGNTVNPRLALVWDINEQLTSKLMYGKAFRAPSFTELGIQNSRINLGNMHLKPESINTVEWAFDYRPFRSLRTALNLYYYRIDHLINITPVNRKLDQYHNNGDQDGYGSEFEWNWQLSDQWSVAGNYAWQYSRNDETKRRVTGVPEHQIYFAAIWRFAPQWQFQTQLNWLGGRTLKPNDERPLKDYETIDFTLRGNKLWGHINFAASLRNAFDANNLEPAGIAILPVNIPMAGRSFYLEASVDF